MGWYNRVALSRVPGTGDTWAVTRDLLPGKYSYKFVMDGTWSYDADLPTFVDGDNVNNYEDVYAAGLSEAAEAARKRILADGGVLTAAEQERLLAYVHTGSATVATA